MNHLTEVFEIIRSHFDVPSVLTATEKYFAETSQSKKVYQEQIIFTRSVQEWLNRLQSEGTYNITGFDSKSVDFFYLVEWMESGAMKDMYWDVKVLKAELITMINKDNIEKFKEINDFWEQMELSLSTMIK